MNCATILVAPELSLAAVPNAGGAGSRDFNALRCGAWPLEAGTAVTLQAHGPSRLRVRSGRLWLTADAPAGAESEDVVLCPGEEWRMAAGERVVIEPLLRHDGALYDWDPL